MFKEFRQDFNKELNLAIIIKEYRNHEIEPIRNKNKVSEMKNRLEEINSSFNEAVD